MTLNTQCLLAVQPGKILVIRALDGVTTDAGHHLAGPRVENFVTDGMGEHPVLPMAFAADLVDGCLGHCRMVGAMGRMAIVAGVGPLVAVFRRVVPLECLFVALTANVNFLPFEQSPIVTGMR